MLDRPGQYGLRGHPPQRPWERRHECGKAVAQLLEAGGTAGNDVDGRGLLSGAWGAAGASGGRGCARFRC